MLSVLVPLAVGFLAVYLCVPICRHLAFMFSVIDLPGGRKIHERGTPLLGGVGIYCGAMLAFIFLPAKPAFLLPVVSGATLILVVGLLDDIHGLSPKIRLVWQFIAASLVIAGGYRIDFLPEVFWGGMLEVVISYVWIIGVTNAFNYLDGMDGLAAGSAVLNFGFLGCILFVTGQYELAVFSIILAVCTLGFLPYNFRGNAKIFLGDAGSTFLGFMLAATALIGHWAQDNIVKIGIPVLILGVPIFDMIFTTIMRIKEGKVTSIAEWLRYGGRDHFHHYLVDIGLLPTGAVSFIYWINISLGISAFMVSNDRAIEGILALVQAAIIFGVIATLMVVGKRRRSGWRREGRSS